GARRDARGDGGDRLILESCLLEETFTLTLPNAAHIRNVPGRKSDVKDAGWIADLLAHGLIRGSFVPPAPIQEVRDLTRTRKQLVREIAQHTQRIQKTLDTANVKITGLVSKRKSTRTRKGACWLKTVLVQAAWAAVRTKNSYYRAQFLRLRARRGPKKAIVAVAASMLTAIYYILRDSAEYRELGGQYFERLDRTKATQRLVKRLRDLGYRVQMDSIVRIFL